MFFQGLRWLGGYPAVTLAQVRESARAIRAKIAQGIDPIQKRRVRLACLIVAQAKLIAFTQAMQGFLEGRDSEWRNQRWSLKFGPLVKMDHLMGKMIQNDKEKEPFA